jgi:ABC-type sulfate/molybdate transport systems ATPase subunit
MFAEAEIRTEIEGEDTEVWQRRIESLFRRLSSGHKIVLLTITRLVELVVERTLVILDEPEAHLHPPLLSAFTRTLSHLLKQQNGVAIIATHSPVVLQEVPKLCVWKLQRSGSLSKVERPEIETFGENVGVLTREIFGLEVVHSGFHQLIETVVDREEDYAAVLRAFHEQLGAEARALVHVLLATKAQEEQDQ